MVLKDNCYYNLKNKKDDNKPIAIFFKFLLCWLMFYEEPTHFNNMSYTHF